jgi:hypothetical protein
MLSYPCCMVLSVMYGDRIRRFFRCRQTKMRRTFWSEIHYPLLHCARTILSEHKASFSNRSTAIWMKRISPFFSVVVVLTSPCNSSCNFKGIWSNSIQKVAVKCKGRCDVSSVFPLYILKFGLYSYLVEYNFFLQFYFIFWAGRGDVEMLCFSQYNQLNQCCMLCNVSFRNAWK